jgi:hypothetical protein
LNFPKTSLLLKGINGIFYYNSEVFKEFKKFKTLIGIQRNFLLAKVVLIFLMRIVYFIFKKN